MTTEQSRRSNDMIIGELLAEAKSSRTQRALIFDKMDENNKVMNNLTVLVQTSITSSNDRLTEVEKDVASQGTSIGELKKFKQRLLIGIAAVGGTGGIIGGVTSGILSKLGVS